MTHPYLGPSYQYRHCVEGCSVADATNAKSDQSARDLRSRYEKADAGQRADITKSRGRTSIFPAPLRFLHFPRDRARSCTNYDSSCCWFLSTSLLLGSRSRLSAPRPVCFLTPFLYARRFTRKSKIQNKRNKATSERSRREHKERSSRHSRYTDRAERRIKYRQRDT